MKHYIPFIFLTLIVCWKPTPIGRGQDNTTKDTLKNTKDESVRKEINKIDSKADSLETKVDSLNDVKHDLFAEAFKLQKEAKKQKPKVVVKEVPVIIYIDTAKEEPQDTVINTSIDYLPDTVKVEPAKKKRFLKRLFHHKKKK